MTILSKIFYHLGDIVSVTLLPLGVGWKLYQKLMLISVDLDKNFDVWSGECKNDYLGNALKEWRPKNDTVCKQATCTGCTDDLITKKSK